LADHREYEIRSKRMATDPVFKNYKEGFWKSPGGKVIYTCASYEAEMINVSVPGNDWASSIYPVMWDVLMGEWTYIGRSL